MIKVYQKVSGLGTYAWLGVTLAMILLTRWSHLGAGDLLPDASYAAFFLAGVLTTFHQARVVLISLVTMTIAVVCTDLIAYSEYCTSWAYPVHVLGLIVGFVFGSIVSLSDRPLFWTAMVGVTASTVLGYELSEISFYLVNLSTIEVGLTEYMIVGESYLPVYSLYAAGYTALIIGVHELTRGLINAKTDHTNRRVNIDKSIF